MHSREITGKEKGPGAENEDRFGRPARRDQKRRVHPQLRQQTPQVGDQRPDLSRQYYAPPDARSKKWRRPGRPADDVVGREDRPFGTDRVSLHRFWKDMERGDEAARLREGSRRAERPR